MQQLGHEDFRCIASISKFLLVVMILGNLAGSRVKVLTDVSASVDGSLMRRGCLIIPAH